MTFKYQLCFLMLIRELGKKSPNSDILLILHAVSTHSGLCYVTKHFVNRNLSIVFTFMYKVTNVIKGLFTSNKQHFPTGVYVISFEFKGRTIISYGS